MLVPVSVSEQSKQTHRQNYALYIRSRVVKSVTLQPAKILLRKAMVSVNGQSDVFPDNLVEIVTLLMENLPYIFFRSISETKDYVMFLFWAASQAILSSFCKNHRANQTRNIVGWLSVTLYCEKVAGATSCVLSTAVTSNTQNKNSCDLPPDNYKQLISFLKLLKNLGR